MLTRVADFAGPSIRVIRGRPIIRVQGTAKAGILPICEKYHRK
jgi:hypothetical protein